MIFTRTNLSIKLPFQKTTFQKVTSRKNIAMAADVAAIGTGLVIAAPVIWDGLKFAGRTVVGLTQRVFGGVVSAAQDAGAKFSARKAA
jgi:hypothetical protein